MNLGHLQESLKAALTLVAEKQRAKVTPCRCHLDGWLPHRWMKKGPVSLSQVVHCNPAEVAYRAHCLSHCCLSSFPKTDSSPRPRRHPCTHTHTHAVTDFHIHFPFQPPSFSLYVLQAKAGRASTDRGRGGKSNEMFDSNKCTAPSFKFCSGRSLSRKFPK